MFCQRRPPVERPAPKADSWPRAMRRSPANPHCGPAATHRSPADKNQPPATKNRSHANKTRGPARVDDCKARGTDWRARGDDRKARVNDHPARVHDVPASRRDPHGTSGLVRVRSARGEVSTSLRFVRQDRWRTEEARTQNNTSSRPKSRPPSGRRRETSRKKATLPEWNGEKRGHPPQDKNTPEILTFRMENISYRHSEATAQAGPTAQRHVRPLARRGRPRVRPASLSACP